MKNQKEAQTEHRFILLLYLLRDRLFLHSPQVTLQYYTKCTYIFMSTSPETFEHVFTLGFHVLCTYA